MSSYWGLWGLHEALHRSDDGQFYANEYDENEPEHPDGPEGFWHGTPSGDLRGAHYGLHVGTYKAASEALNARIGKPAEGYWDGTRVYGETPVVSPGAGYGLGPPGDPKRVENPYDAHLPNGKATFSDGTPIPMHFKPAILPVRIKGLMANTPHEPYEDDEANDLMTERLNQGRTRHGFYYTNDGEGGYLHPKTGKWLTSISAVVPNGDHLQVLDPNWPGHHTASTDDWGLHTAADWPWSWTPKRTTLHRGLGVDYQGGELPPHITEAIRRAIVTGQPDINAAHQLLDHIGETGHQDTVYDRQHQGLGPYWTTSPDVATHFAENEAMYGSKLHVMLSGDHDGRGIDDEPEEDEYGPIPRLEGEDEVRLHPGTKINVHTVRVKPSGRGEWTTLMSDFPHERRASTDGIRYAANISGDYTPHWVWPGANQEPDVHLHPAELRAYARKGNRYSPKTLNNLKRDIARDGVLHPIIVQTDGKKVTVADGHHRIMAALALGLESVPVWVEHDQHAEGHRVRGGLADWLTAGGSPREPGWHMEPDETDGIRYAQVVEADVADDLMRLAGANGELPEGLTFQHHPEGFAEFPDVIQPTQNVSNAWPTVTAHDGDRMVGHLQWHGDHPRKKGEVWDIRVHPDYQRRGVGTAMFDWTTDQVEPDLHHSPNLSDEGRAFMEAEEARPLAQDRYEAWRNDQPMPKRFAAVNQDLVDRLHGEFHDWYHNGGGIDQDETWEDHLDPISSDVPARGPVGDWGNIERFLKNSYPAAHKGLGMGQEEAAHVLDGRSEMPYLKSQGITPYETGPKALATYGYDPAEIAAGMVLLHNKSHPFRGDMAQVDQDRLTDIAQKRFQMQRDYEQRTKTAMPAIDAYDNDPQFDDDYNPIPGTEQFPEEHRYDEQEIQPGPYYHATDQVFNPGDVVQSHSQLHGHQGDRGNHADWVWMGRDPDTALGHAGPHLYEVEPMDEGPWEWNHDIFSNPGDDGRYVSPRARVVRVVPHNYPFWKDHKHAAARTAMPTWHHLTDDPEFAPDHSSPHGLYVTQQPDWWATEPVIGRRPYIADMDVPADLAEQLQSESWANANEIAIPNDQLHRVTVQQVRPRHARTAMPAPLPKGVYFRYHPELVWSPGVTAHAPGGKQVGSLEWYDDNHVMVDLGTRRPGEIDRIQVPEDHRGQSIATSMFDFAKQHEPRLHHSDQLTEDGRGWSEYEQSRHARLAGKNGPPPPMTFEPFNTMWTNGIMARHAEDGRPLAHLHWYPDGEIETIRVHPQMRGRDIGKAILTHAASHPETYEASGGIQPSNTLTPDGRAFARSMGHNPSDDEVTPAEGEDEWAWKAVNKYVPMHVPYTGQNEDEMSKHLEDEWTPPTQKTAATNDGWPVWWRGRHRPGVEFDKRWHPNHPEHVPAPWESSL